MRRNIFYLLTGFVLAALLLGDPPPQSTPRRSPAPAVASGPAASPPASLVEPEKSRIVFQGTRYVVGSRVNFRSGPSLDDGVIGSLVEGAKVSVGPQQGSWTLVRLPDGREGWMASRYLAARLPEPATARARTVAAPSSRQITAARREIIRQSIASYPGSCPCPYNVDRAGRRCGERSAWSRPGGYAPICYESDVTEARLATYFARRAPDR